MPIDPTATVHPTAIVEDGAVIGAHAKIGPFCTVGPQVALGEGVELISHVAVAGITSVGARTRIWPFASIGHQPQDLKYAGEETRLEIGSDCMLREHVTMNPGTVQGGGLTKIGDRCLFMMSTHAGHDCKVGNGVIVANNVPLAGHVEVGDHAVIGGNAAVHQFCRIGHGAMVGGLTGVERDVIPYGSVTGDRAHLAGLNLIGLKRHGASRDEIHALRAAFREIFETAGDLSEKVEKAAAAHAGSALVGEVVAFLRAESKRSFVTPRRD